MAASSTNLTNPTNRTNAKFDPPRNVTITVAAAAAALAASTLLTGVADLFQSRGQPFEAVIAAERACAAYVDAYDRETCTRARMALAQGDRIAQR
jgi:hypothetical protein